MKTKRTPKKATALSTAGQAPAISSPAMLKELRELILSADIKIVPSLIAQLGWTHLLHIIPQEELKRDFLREDVPDRAMRSLFPG